MRKLCFALSAAAALAGLCMTAEAGSVLPSVMESYEKNADNSYSVSYLEEDPYLVNIYEGYGFAKDYGSARGHAYVLEDVGKTEMISERTPTPLSLKASFRICMRMSAAIAVMRIRSRTANLF